MGKSTFVGSRRAALGELTNAPGVAVNPKVTWVWCGVVWCVCVCVCPSLITMMSQQKTLPSKATTKPALTQKARQKPAPVSLPPAVPAPEVIPVCEESADVSMKEEELCQAFSDALLTVEDIDDQDGDMPQLCAEYVKDIYSYLMALEVNYTSTWM